MTLSAAAYAQQAQQTAWTVVEQDLGGARFGTFTITDSAIDASSTVLVVQAAGPYTGKGTLGDEFEMDQVQAVAEPGSGTATVRWVGTGWLAGNVKFAYTVAS